MKVFIRRLLYFSILFLLVNLLAYRFIAEPLLYKGYFIPKREMQNYRSFLLGDSHAKAIRQTDLDRLKIFNLAYDTDSYFDSALKLKYLLRNHLADTVYICVDNHTLSQYREDWTNRSRSLYYSTYKDYNKYYPIKHFDFWVKKNILPYFPLLQTKNSKLFKKYLISRIQSEVPRNFDNFDISTIPDEQLKARSVKRVKTQFPDEKQSEKLNNTLEEMIVICAKNDVAVYGIKFPLPAEFIYAMGDKSYKADSVFVKHDLPVLDFTDAFPDSTHFFRDQDHVNYKGSEVLARMLKDEISN
ncbi:hypothetical protein [Maribellus sediminis]|uniref:hypothetical protein n=1 Tax=Maribellus sediminis TaxID=2696285 RepID=UPI00142F4C73|nr:hypothetical protein [Maribellus sediminis]